MSQDNSCPLSVSAPAGGEGNPPGPAGADECKADCVSEAWITPNVAAECEAADRISIPIETDEAPPDSEGELQEEQAPPHDEDRPGKADGHEEIRPIPRMRINYALRYFQSGDWENDLASYRTNGIRQTGFPVLDSVQLLYPGLYVVGAISSLGKTTFIHQLGDQLAEGGQPVLFFSFEQTAAELFSKSISRRINQHASTDPLYRRFSSVEIRTGAADGTRELAEQTADYLAAVQNNMCIIECRHEVTVEDIERLVTHTVTAFHVQPVVIVDYLQIVGASTIAGRPLTDQRTRVDHVVQALKTLQKQHQLIIIAICSLNRMNYLQPVDFESFKESGCIEYTADVVWGLQLELLNKPRFSYKTVGNGKTTETTLSEKRQMVNAAKAAAIRSLQLVALKNRFGVATYQVNLAYEPRYDTFRSVASVQAPGAAFRADPSSRQVTPDPDDEDDDEDDL